LRISEAKEEKMKFVFSAWSEKKKQELYEQYKDNFRSQANGNEPEPFSSCHIWKGSSQNGYPSISQGHGKSKIKMHILSAERKYGRVPRSNECVSHLCHRKSCIQPDHLIIEPITTNNARKGCHCAIVVQGLLVGLCWHEPRCLRADTSLIGVGFKPSVTNLTNILQDQ